MEPRFSTTSLRSTLEKAVRYLHDEGGFSGLTPALCKKLLLSSNSEAVAITANEMLDPLSAEGLCLVKGYPFSPLYLRLSDCLWYWMVKKKCPSLSLPTMFMLNEETTIDERRTTLESVGESVEGLYSQWDTLSEDDRVQRLLEILKLLDLRGVLDVLGLRCTAGSCSLLPPPRHALLASFERQHHPQAKLSVGGRALSKHCHRDGTHQWWGSCTGTEAEKNKHALEVALRILDSAVWINIHTLPHNVCVLEVRTEEGYGLRWLSDGSEFRGFLEPQMPDGHSVGWRH